MKYYLNLEGDEDKFRLQTDGTWRKLENNDFSESDFFTDDTSKLLRIQEVDSKIFLDGKEWDVNPTSGGLFDDNVLNHRVYVRRENNPSLPSKKQLIETIAKGIDNRTNTLILNSNGVFELRDFETIDISTEDPTIIVRSESYSEGNGYVGIEASKDAKLIDDAYRENLEYWLMHLETGKTNFFSDGELPYRNIDDIVKEINDIN